MPTWIDHYKALRATWVARRGVGATSTATGSQLPMMIASDALALLGPFSGAILRFMENKQPRVNGNYQWLPYSAQPIDTFGVGTVTPAMYLMKGYPKAGAAYLRTLKVGSFTLEIRPDWGALFSREPAVAEGHKQLMAAWQAAITVAADSMRGAGGISRRLGAIEIEAFWSKLYATVIALDVAGEVPVESDWDLAKDLARTTGTQAQEVIVDAAEIAGRAAAEIAQTAGEAAGSLASGFFSQAGLTALVVTGGALYIALS